MTTGSTFATEAAVWIMGWMCTTSPPLTGCSDAFYDATPRWPRSSSSMAPSRPNFCHRIRSVMGFRKRSAKLSLSVAPGASYRRASYRRGRPWCNGTSLRPPWAPTNRSTRRSPPACCSALSARRPIRGQRRFAWRRRRFRPRPRCRRSTPATRTTTTGDGAMFTVSSMTTTRPATRGLTRSARPRPTARPRRPCPDGTRPPQTPRPRRCRGDRGRRSYRQRRGERRGPRERVPRPPQVLRGMP